MEAAQHKIGMIKITRTWAMPNKNTFQIKPVKEMMDRICVQGLIIVDAFANTALYGTIRNDINPEYRTDYNMDGLSFMRQLKSGFVDIVLYDPPFSINQALKEYNGYGADKLNISVGNMKYWSECKNEVSRILKTGGKAICFGWSSMGLGKKRGFFMEEVHLIPHGGTRNDTIITIESKQ